MIKKLGIIFGMAFLFGGLLAFVPGVTKDGMYFGFFMVNTAHNILHIVSGAVFLFASMFGARAARLWFQLFGSFYMALAAIGFVVGNGLIFGLIMNSPFDSWGHAGLALAMLLIGFALPKKTDAANSSLRNHDLQQVDRYHPLLVALHWIIAVFAFAALYFGRMHLVAIPNSDPMKIYGLRIHMTVGILLLVLVSVRLFVRQVTAHPRQATTGNTFLDTAAKISHLFLYIALIGMSLMGLALAFQAGLFGVVFGHQDTLPPDLWVYWPRWGHFILSRILMFLIALHVCGALYHTLILKDHLLRRMWFGKRSSNEVET